MASRKLRCSARSARTKKPCRAWAILGGRVCGTHGGRAPQVKRKAAERLADLIDPDRALREAARLAYSDIGELLDAHGAIKPVRQWPDHIRAAVSSMKVTKYNRGGNDGEQEDVVELKLWDKPKNIELLFKHLGLLVERVEVSGELTLVEQRLNAARARLARRTA